LPHHLTDGLRRLPRLAVGPGAGLVHRVEDPAVHRLETVAHVGQRPRSDDRHRVVEEGALHLLLDLDHLDVGVVECLLHAVVGHLRRSPLSSVAVRDAYASMKRTSLAFSWMNVLRESTSSPMSREKMSSAIAASST